MTRLQIQRALPNQAATLSALARAAKAHWPYTQAQLAAWHSDLRFQPESIARLPTWIMVRSPQQVLAVYQLAACADHISLEHFWVLPSAMGQGIGKRMLAHACHEASSLGQTWLDIDADPNAEGFYLACGAQRLGSVPAPTDTEPNRVRPQLQLACYLGANL